MEKQYINEAKRMQQLAGILTEAPQVSKSQDLFPSLDKKNISDEQLNDLEGLTKIIHDVLWDEFDTVADNPEEVAKEYIARRKYFANKNQ